MLFVLLFAVVVGCSFLLIVGVYRCLLLFVAVDVCPYRWLRVVVAVCCLLLLDGRCGCSLFAAVVASVAVACGYLLVLFVVVGAC